VKVNIVFRFFVYSRTSNEKPSAWNFFKDMNFVINLSWLYEKKMIDFNLKT